MRTTTKRQPAKTVFDTWIADHKANPVTVHDYYYEQEDHYHLSVLIYRLSADDHTRSLFERGIKHGEIIPENWYTTTEHGDECILSSVDYVSAAIVALKEFITLSLDIQKHYRESKAEPVTMHKGLRDRLTMLVHYETKIRLAEEQLVYFLYLKSQGITTFDPDYSGRYGQPYAGIHGRGTTAHLYRKT